MAKLSAYHKISGLLVAMLTLSLIAGAQYTLRYQPVDRDSSFITDTLKLQRTFQNLPSCMSYVKKIPALLQKKGYPNASVDSTRYDSLNAICVVYVGDGAKYSVLNTDSIDQSILAHAGISKRNPPDILDLKKVQERILNHMENTGYPFASVAIDSLKFTEDTMYAVLKLDKGPLYKIDSIRNYGNGSISASFLQQYLGIKNGSIYRKEKMQQISQRLRELPYLQEKQAWNLSLLGTGSVLNLYLDTRKSSEVNVLLGLLPANAQTLNNKLLVTGEANINLKNSLGGGETIGVNWQQIQVKSPRLNLLFQQPYLFGTPFGMNFNFDLLKKDSSYVNIAILLGAANAD
jgi:outer membrane protein assembly factor BamA